MRNTPRRRSCNETVVFSNVLRSLGNGFPTLADVADGSLNLYVTDEVNMYTDYTYTDVLTKGEKCQST